MRDVKTFMQQRSTSRGTWEFALAGVERRNNGRQVYLCSCHICIDSFLNGEAKGLKALATLSAIDHR